jgi:UV DNA damage repair endonuclease
MQIRKKVAAILVGSRDQRTQICKGAIQESFQQSLVDIGSVVSEEKIFFKFHPPFFLICIIDQNRQKFKVQGG